MKLIEHALKGKSFVATNFEELISAYSKCIEIIGLKEEVPNIMNLFEWFDVKV